MKLKRNSWHYKLNMLLKGYIVEKDFCSYFWETTFHVLALIVLSVLFLLASFICIVMWKISIPGFLGISLLSWLACKYENYRMRKDEEEYDRMMQDFFNEKPVGFFKAAWRKFKDKTCHKIEWE